MPKYFIDLAVLDEINENGKIYIKEVNLIEPLGKKPEKEPRKVVYII